MIISDNFKIVTQYIEKVVVHFFTEKLVKLPTMSITALCLLVSLHILLITRRGRTFLIYFLIHSVGNLGFQYPVQKNVVERSIKWKWCCTERPVEKRRGFGLWAAMHRCLLNTSLIASRHTHRTVQTYLCLFKSVQERFGVTCCSVQTVLQTECTQISRPERPRPY
jgi:hypothetical protein